MQQMTCQVRSGSSEAIYNVTIERDGARFRMFCTCDAGRKGQICGHRTNLLESNFSALVEGDAALLQESLREMIAGTAVAGVVAEVRAAEADLDAAKKRLGVAKANLKTAFRRG